MIGTLKGASVALLLAIGCTSNGGREVSPPIGTFSELAPTSQSRDVDRLFAGYIDGIEPGCAVGVTKNGAPVHARGYGYANLDHELPLTPDSIFRIASVSKQFTVAAIALLEESGALTLDDEIGSWLPDLDPDVHHVTVRQLIAHTGRIPDYDALASLVTSAVGGPFRMGNEDYLTTEEFYSLTTKLKRLEEAEEGQYSNIGYFWLGRIVEKISGDSLAEFARREIFEPAGMWRTFFNDNANAVVKNRATGYAPIKDGEFEIFETNLDWVGDGGVYTSISEFFKWNDQFIRPTIGADPEALRGKLIEPITEGGSWFGINYRHAYGLWLSPEADELQKIWHPGSWVAYQAMFARYPEEKMAIIFFCNRPDIDRFEILEELEAIYFDY